LVAGSVERPLDRAYTPTTVARFLGWLTPSGEAQEKVGDALAALQFIEEGSLTEDDFTGLTTTQAGAVIEEARRARSARDAAARAEAKEAQRAEREAREARKRKDTAAEKRAEKQREAALRREEKAREKAKQEGGRMGRRISEELKGGKIGHKQARQRARELGPTPKRGAAPPDIEEFARRTAGQLSRLLDEEYDAERVKGLRELVKYREHLSDYQRQQLALELEELANRATAFADQLGRDSAATPTTSPALPVGS
jgi:hypothetical protein